MKSTLKTIITAILILVLLIVGTAALSRTGRANPAEMIEQSAFVRRTITV